MNQKEIIQKINKLKQILPSPELATRGRVMIFANDLPHNNNNRRVAPWLIWASGFALAILVAAVSITNLNNSNQALAASLNPEKLTQEFNDLTINIELQNISYHQDVNQSIASALNEIGSNQAKHLNPDILQSEEQNLNLNSGTNPKIDQLLNKIIF